MSSNRRNYFRPTLEGLEARDMPAPLGLAGFVGPVVSPSASALVTAAASQTMNQKVVAFCQSHLGQKVGGGECAHLASEALRVAGADFVAHDPHNNGDYVWGNLVTQITAQGGHRTDSSPSAAVQPGDIIQFQGVTLSNGASYLHHTAVVASVDAQGRPTAVYEQNVGTGSGAFARFVKLDPLNLNTMVSGAVHIYRAVSRPDAPGKVQFSVVNDTGRAQTVTIWFNGRPVGTMALAAFNTLNSYQYAWYQWSGGGNWTISVGGRTVALNNAGGYEVYTAPDGQAAIRQI
jgi:hypothetical protein